MKSDESFLGFAHRLASCNFMSASKMVGLYSDEPYLLITRDSSKRLNLYQILSKLSGPEVHAALDTRQLKDDSIWMVQFKRVYYCPECLMHEPYHRVLWEFKNYAVCHRHQRLLRDSCRCGLKVKIEDVVKDQCPACQTALSSPSDEQKFEEPFSQFAGATIADSELQNHEKMAAIRNELQTIEPYIRLQFQGKLVPFNTLRDKDPKRFVDAHIRAYELLDDQSETARLLSNYVCNKVNRNQIGRAMNPFKKVLEGSTDRRFENILKEVILKQRGSSNSKEVSIEFISRIWRVDKDNLVRALSKSLPNFDENKSTVKINEFEKYLDKVIVFING